MFFCYRMYKKN